MLEFELKFNKADLDRIRDAHKDAMQVAGQDGEDEAKKSVNRRTGALRSSLEFQLLNRRGDLIRGRFIAGQPNVVNPETGQPTSRYAFVIEDIYRSIIGPFIAGYINSMRRGRFF